MIKTVTDGNTAAAHVAYAFTEVSAIYPITPSSPMAEQTEIWTKENKPNLFGQVPKLIEMQSESGAIGAIHGALTAGALASGFTSSQGLLLMIPNLYKIAGELLPFVLHVSARAVATQALNIFGDHSDVTACRQTGFAMLSSATPQECADLALCAHLATLLSSVPFMHFFDGFRTSHELTNLSLPNREEMLSLVRELDVDGEISRFRQRALNPDHPLMRGTAQNDDVYFQNRERANPYYDRVHGCIEKAFRAVERLTGRAYRAFDYVGDEQAESVVVAMGSATQTAEEYVLHALKEGKKYGVLKVRLYRPFSAQAFVNALPKTVKRIAVLDRTKESGALGEPLYLDVIAALQENGRTEISVVGGRYGLGGKDFNADMVAAVFENLQQTTPKNRFTVGIDDDVTHTSLPLTKTMEEQAYACKIFGFGSDGTVGACKRAVKLLQKESDFVQAFFCYDSKKSGGVTVSHLRFSKTPIRAEYLVGEADFVACHHPSYVQRFDLAKHVKRGGTFLLNAPTDENALNAYLSPAFLQKLYEKQVRLYLIDGTAIAKKHGLNGKISAVLQRAFFQLSPFSGSLEELENSVRQAFQKKGDDVVRANLGALKDADAALHEYPLQAQKDVEPLQTQAFDGNHLPVSAFTPDGSIETATTRHEKRGVAHSVPRWDKNNCIQCGRCAFSCPHATIRPYLIADGAHRPQAFETAPAMQAAGYGFRMQVFPLDCMGCGVCADVCPVNRKNRDDERKCALVMHPIDEEKPNDENRKFAESLPLPPDELTAKMPAMKRLQFQPPLFEFSGACAGCGETPYIKALTQRFGDRLLIANATGCSSIYGGTYPSCPYAKNQAGHGPAWANSLFENNAEFGLGMRLAYAARRKELRSVLQKLCEVWENDRDGSRAVSAMLENPKSREHADELLALCQNRTPQTDEERELLGYVVEHADCLVEKSVWLVGGDGWAYDIGFGGLDHALATGENIKVLVLDSEVYSNTGGQTSKATEMGATAKFSTGGKRTKKKNLGLSLMHYGTVYIAQCAMGADERQFLNALEEAENYDGPALLICYSPCISHGFEMQKSQTEQKLAVECGYWQLYRYRPTTGELLLDSKAPTKDASEFFSRELRFAFSDDALLDRAKAEKRKTRALLESLSQITAKK